MAVKKVTMTGYEAAQLFSRISILDCGVGIFKITVVDGRKHPGTLEFTMDRDTMSDLRDVLSAALCAED